MSDVAFVAVTIVVFAALALAVRGVEHLVGPAPENAPESAPENEGGEVPGDRLGTENGVPR